MAIAWVPQGDGLFVVAHADGNIYIYDKVKIFFLQFDKLILFFIFLVPLVLTCLLICCGRIKREALIPLFLLSKKLHNSLLFMRDPARSSFYYFLSHGLSLCRCIVKTLITLCHIFMDDGYQKQIYCAVLI